jgi:WD40 repeat protein
MPRIEKPLGPGNDPVTAFARDLRKLRELAGSPTYRELAGRTRYSTSTLAEVTAGKKLPTLAATVAFVRACGGDVRKWESRWHETVTSVAPPQPREEGRAPYAGLAAQDDAELFFGREDVVEDLVRKVGQHRFVAVLGASGAGKSSVLRAGLLARATCPVLYLTPGRKPLDALAASLSEIAGQPVDVRQAGTARLVLRQIAAERELLLVVDQFEELFTSCEDPADADLFIDVLTEGAVGVKVVVGVRTDFYPHCAARPELAEVLRDAQVLVGPMNSEQLRLAITEPAVACGARLESALVATIMSETAGRPGVLPLVSHALRETWRRRRGTTLTLAGYQETGGIAHALARTADETFDALDLPGQEIARSLLLRMIALGEGTEDTKRLVYFRELDMTADTAEVIERLTRARLVTADGNGLQITHEALVHGWPRLREWLATSREAVRLHRQLTEATDAWEELGRDPAGLYRGVRLEQALALATTAFTARERDFLRASRSAHDQRIWRKRALVTACALLAVIATFAAIVAVSERSTAIRQRDDARFRQVLAESDRLRDGDLSLSAQLALVAHRMRPQDRSTETRLLAAWNAPLATPLLGHRGNVYLTTFSPDGTLLATAGEDRTARLWDTRTRTPVGEPLTGHTGWLSSAVFSPDGRTLATAGDDGTVRLYDVRERRLIDVLTGGDGSIYLIAFSPDGRTLATANENGTARLWRLADRTSTSLPGHTGPVRSLAFSPDGSRFAAGGDDSAVLVWNTANPAAPVTLTGHTGIVHSVAFSPDGQVIATGSRDTTVRLWRTDGTALGVPLTAHTGAVWSVAFNADGVLATGSADSTARLWNTSDPARPMPIGTKLAGSGGAIYALGFSGDGRTLATGGADGVVRLWSLPAGLLIGHRAPVNFASAGGGGLVATGAKDNTVRLWDAADPSHPKPLSEIPAPQGPLQSCTDCQTYARFSPDNRVLAVLTHAKVLRLWDISDPRHPVARSPELMLKTRYSAALAFSPDGRTLITNHDDSSGQVWDVTDPASPVEAGRLTGFRDKINCAAFSKDGKLLATGTADRRILVWDLTSPGAPRRIGELSGHENAINALAFSADGRTLASASPDRTVRLWDVAGNTVRHTLSGHTKGVLSIDYSPDGRTLATSSADGTIRLWDPETGTAIGTAVPIGPSQALAFHPDGRHLVTGDGTNTPRLLDLDLPQGVERICSTTRGVLTQDQWELMFAGRPFAAPC